jgi:hypothetical protein
MSNTARELLELAAKAAGIRVIRSRLDELKRRAAEAIRARDKQ